MGFLFVLLKLPPLYPWTTLWPHDATFECIGQLFLVPCKATHLQFKIVQQTISLTTISLSVLPNATLSELISSPCCSVYGLSKNSEEKTVMQWGGSRQKSHQTLPALTRRMTSLNLRLMLVARGVYIEWERFYAGALTCSVIDP